MFLRDIAEPRCRVQELDDFSPCHDITTPRHTDSSSLVFTIHTIPPRLTTPVPALGAASLLAWIALGYILITPKNGPAINPPATEASSQTVIDPLSSRPEHTEVLVYRPVSVIGSDAWWRLWGRSQKRQVSKPDFDCNPAF
jgi:hypothetical protein